MKAFKVELLIIDFDELGEEAIKIELANVRYPNRCITPDVKKVTCADIGQWSDDHPLNNRDKSEDEYHRIFNSTK